MKEINPKIANAVVSFQKNFSELWMPILLDGTAGSGKTALALLMSNVFGANIAFITTDPDLGINESVFEPKVEWDQISAVVVDELNGWDKESLNSKLPILLKDAEKKGKGVILIAQDASEFVRLIPTDAYVFGVSVGKRDDLIKVFVQNNLAETGTFLGRDDQ